MRVGYYCCRPSGEGVVRNKDCWYFCWGRCAFELCGCSFGQKTKTENINTLTINSGNHSLSVPRFKKSAKERGV